MTKYKTIKYYPSIVYYPYVIIILLFYHYEHKLQLLPNMVVLSA